MPLLRDLAPDPRSVVDMHVGDLAGYLLEVFLSTNQGMQNRQTICGDSALAYARPGEGPHRDVLQACSEAFSWLESNGLICPHPEQGHHGWYVATRRARSVRDRTGVKALIASQELPESFLHSDIVQHARPLFLQGRFDTAVFEAFKTVEVEMRRYAKLGNDILGTKLASRAFDPNNGPLTDLQAEPGEREALRNLMAGALGSYKNPSSHRRMDLTAAEARELLMFASHLLRIIELNSLL